MKIAQVAAKSCSFLFSPPIFAGFLAAFPVAISRLTHIKPEVAHFLPTSFQFLSPLILLQRISIQNRVTYEGLREKRVAKKVWYSRNSNTLKCVSPS